MRARKPTLIDPAWSEDYKSRWRGYPTCASCGRKMRPANTSLADNPGTVSRATLRACQSCYRNPATPRYAVAARPQGHLAELAEGWNADEKSVALSACSRYAANEARELLDILGLFDADREVGARAVGPLLSP